MAPMQLSGEAEGMQIENAMKGGVFNMGGAAVANYVSILETRKMKDARVNNLGGLLTRTARLFPSHHAVIAEEKNWIWKEVDQRVQTMAFCLKKSRN